MIYKNKLNDKSFRKTYKLVLNQLKNIMMLHGINSMQKLHMSKSLEKYRTKNVTTEQPSEDNGASIELKSISKTNETDSQNKWGHKSLYTIINEKSEKILQLQAEIENYKNENLKLEEDRKRIKIEKESAETNQSILEEKNKLIFQYKTKISYMETEINEFKLQLAGKDEINENLKELNKKLVEFNKSNKNTPDTSSGNLVATINTLNSSPLQTFSQNNEEILSLKSEIQNLTENIFIKETKISNLEMLLNNALFRLDYISKFENSEEEKDLYEELNNISTAFDMANTTNSNLEKQINLLNSKNLDLISENTILKNKIKILDDSKNFMEKEKRKLDDIKDTLLKEAKILQENTIHNERNLFDKEKKIQEYRCLIISLQGNEKVLEKEISQLKNSYKNLQEELKNLKNQFFTIESENEDLKNKNKLFNKISSGELSLMESIDKYKKVLCCSLCENNIKNCVLSKCMHTFCESCVEARFKFRQRSCPNCQTEFTMANVKKLYL